MTQQFNYMLLSRLQADCDYYLGYGLKDKNRLWAKDEQEQINKMRELYNSLNVKPDWISMDAIDKYAIALDVK